MEDTKNMQPKNTPEEVSPSINRPEEISGSIPVEYPQKPTTVYEEGGSKLGLIIFLIIIFCLTFFAIYWFFIKDSDFLNSLNREEELQNIELTYWGLWDDASVISPIIDRYVKSNPNVSIKYEKVSKDKYRERLLARSAASTGPDIFQFHNTWLTQITRVASAIPKDIIPDALYEETFYDIYQKDLKIEQNYYGVPLYIDGLVIIYNKDLLTQAGISEPPRVWVGGEEDMLSVASKLTVRDTSQTIVTSGVAIGEAENVPHYGEILSVLMLQNGAKISELTSAEATESLQVFKRFSEDGIWSVSMPNAVSAFTEGKLAMLLAPTWHIHQIKSQNPSLNVSVYKLPMGIDNKEISVSSYWVEGVSKFSKNQREAWKFLKFLSEYDQLAELYNNQSKVRLFGNAYSRKDMADLLKDNEYLAPVIEQAKASSYVSLPVADLTFDNGINDEILQYLKNAINDTTNGVDYKTALQTASMGVSQVYSRYIE